MDKTEAQALPFEALLSMPLCRCMRGDGCSNLHWADLSHAQQDWLERGWDHRWDHRNASAGCPLCVMTEDARLFALMFECGDYYCEGVHVAGVFRTELAAVAARDGLRQDPERLPTRWCDNPATWQFSIHPIAIGEVDLQ